MCLCVCTLQLEFRLCHGKNECCDCGPHKKKKSHLRSPRYSALLGKKKLCVCVSVRFNLNLDEVTRKISAVVADHTHKKKNSTTAQGDTRAHRAHKRPPTCTAVAQQSTRHAQQTTHAITEHEGKVHGHGRLQRRLRKQIISSCAADARPINCKSNVVPLSVTRTNGPWTHTSDDSYIYQLSLVLRQLQYLLQVRCGGTYR